LTEVGRMIIGHLSKGFRQRVGLADALVHEPDLVILDEPTLGLDPNQIRAVRQLIKSLGGQHTVLISTHILSEVEMTCNHVLILHEGRILAANTPENLQAALNDGGQVVAEIAAPEAELRGCWEAMAELEHFNLSAAEGDYWRCALRPRAGVDLRPIVFEAVRARGWRLRELTRNRPSLEDVFVHLTRTAAEQEEEL
jgi:ABC-2 type transport system ATP-binding protein